MLIILIFRNKNNKAIKFLFIFLNEIIYLERDFSFTSVLYILIRLFCITMYRFQKPYDLLLFKHKHRSIQGIGVN